MVGKMPSIKYFGRLRLGYDLYHLWNAVYQPIKRKEAISQ
jgi:hypothetical protein